MKKAPIVIRRRAFIGNNAIVLPGIEIGEKAIVGAGAVVTRRVEGQSIVGGVPATVIRQCAVDSFEHCHNNVLCDPVLPAMAS
jgi:acetyltransferase-like isoleucine patch superfamily enzyme